MKFTLEIELGNEAMIDPEHVRVALLRIADQVIALEKGWTFDHWPTRIIRDTNGNTVGKWEVTESSPLENVPMPWCEACGGYHHATAPGCFKGTERDKSAKTQPMLTLQQASMLHYLREALPASDADKTNEEIIALMTNAEREEFNDYGGTPQAAKTPNVYVGALPHGVTAEPVGVSLPDFEGPTNPQDTI